jgi:hypothetical protein
LWNKKFHQRWLSLCWPPFCTLFQTPMIHPSLAIPPLVQLVSQTGKISLFRKKSHRTNA